MGKVVDNWACPPWEEGLAIFLGRPRGATGEIPLFVFCAGTNSPLAQATTSVTNQRGLSRGPVFLIRGGKRSGARLHRSNTVLRSIPRKIPSSSAPHVAGLVCTCCVVTTTPIFHRFSRALHPLNLRPQAATRWMTNTKFTELGKLPSKQGRRDRNDEKMRTRKHARQNFISSQK